MVERPKHGTLKAIYYKLVTPIVVLFWLIAEHLTARLTSRVAPLFGKVMLLGKGSRIVGNMKMVLARPEWNEEEWMSLRRRHTAQLGLTIIESIQLARMSNETLHEHLLLSGEDLLLDALRGRRGVVLLVNHIGNLGFVGAALGVRGYDVTITRNVMPVQFMENRLDSLLLRCNVEQVTLGEAIIEASIRVLRRNGIFAAIVDYSVTRRHAEWMPFGAAEMEVSLVPAVIALRNKAAILAVDAKPLGNNHHLYSLRRVDCSGDGKTVIAREIVRDELLRVGHELSKRPEQWWRWDYARLRAHDNGGGYSSVAFL